MLGWIHVCVQSMVLKYHGLAMWKTVLENAGIDPETEYSNKENYDDNESFRIFRSLGTALGISTEDTWESFGGWLILYAMDNGWDMLLNCLATNLHEFLDNLNSMHFFIDQIAFRSELRGPAFKCEARPDGTLRLHYYSLRKGLFPLVKGLVRQSAKVLFGVDIKISVTERSQERRNNLLSEHVIFTVEPNDEDTILVKANPAQKMAGLGDPVKPLSMSVTTFCNMFPTHVAFNKQLIIEHCGIFLQHEFALATRRTTKLTDIFQLIQPDDVQLTFKGITTYMNSMFIFQLKQNMNRNDKNTTLRPLSLKGQMILVNGGNNLLYINSPHITTVRGLLDVNIFLSDIQMHDATRDLIMLNQSRMCQQELNKKLEETVKKLKRMAEELEIKRIQKNNLLFESMPTSIMEQILHAKMETVPAQEFADSTCLICDLPHFPIIVANCGAQDVIHLIADIFTRYDRLVALHGCYKVVSMMDSYFVIGGVPVPSTDHAARVLNLAMGFLMEAKQIKVPTLNFSVMIRVAVHSGPVVAGVIGKTRIRYCIFGETVNVTKRLLQHIEPGKILISNAAKISAAKAINDGFEFTNRGYLTVGKNQATCTFYLDKNLKKSVWEIIDRPKGDDQSVDGYRELHQNDERSWSLLEENMRKQQKVIAVMQNQSSPFSIIALEKLKRMKEVWRDRRAASRDSGISPGSTINGNCDSKVCVLM